MATYRMLVTDLDGTLLNREAKLSERNKAAVRRAVEKGIPIVLCSGRFPAEGLADFGRELGLDIGCTLIGMHLKSVAIPIRLSMKSIGEAALSAALTRPKLIGGERAHYTL